MSPKIAFRAAALLMVLCFPALIFSQDNSQADPPPAAAVDRAPTSAEIMRDRISRAKALIAVKNYPAAVYELRNIKRESSDPAVHRVIDVLLMHSFLEQGEYALAQQMLKEARDAKGPGAATEYLMVAGQVVSSARSQADRYKALGLSLNDRNLPVAASADIEGMRNTLELVVEQSKSMVSDESVGRNAAALLEESSTARGNLARDAYDAKRWKDSVADAREQMIGSRSVILSAVGAPDPDGKESEVGASTISSEKSSFIAEKASGPAVPPVKAPSNHPAASDGILRTDGAERESGIAKIETDPGFSAPAGSSSGSVLPTDRPVRVIRSAERSPELTEADKRDQPNVRSSISAEDIAGNKASAEGPLTVGSLIGYATRRVSPIYPRQARNMRLTGVVIVKVLVDEDGSVSEIADADGPAMLTQAATDAIRKWKFRPFTRDGEPVKATGFVSFNFNL